MHIYSQSNPEQSLLMSIQKGNQYQVFLIFYEDFIKIRSFI